MFHSSVWNLSNHNYEGSIMFTVFSALMSHSQCIQVFQTEVEYRCVFLHNITWRFEWPSSLISLCNKNEIVGKGAWSWEKLSFLTYVRCSWEVRWRNVLQLFGYISWRNFLNSMLSQVVFEVFFSLGLNVDDSSTYLTKTMYQASILLLIPVTITSIHNNVHMYIWMILACWVHTSITRSFE